MSKAFFMLMFALVLLGFLMSTTMNMSSEIEQLKADNQKLAFELNQLRSGYEALAQENDALKVQNANLNSKFEALQTAYVTENQARLKAELELANYRSMVANMANNVQTTAPSICPPAPQQITNSDKLLSSELVPAGAASLVGLAMASLILILNNLHRKQKKSKSLPSQLRSNR